jgi:hemolysin III
MHDPLDPLNPDQGNPPPPATLATPTPAQRPRMRGVLHQWAFVVSLVTGTALVLLAGGAKATVAALIYAISVSGLFGVSALYHRVTWSAAARRRMRQLDHAMIFVLIAGTYTPVGLLVLEGGLGLAVLVIIWAGAVAGIVLNLAWRSAPRWVGVSVYIALGWVAVIVMPQMIRDHGFTWVGLLLLGGLAYSVGALIYARRRPDPVPAVFGYHEVFHLLVIAGVAAHLAAITGVVLSA